MNNQLVSSSSSSNSPPSWKYDVFLSFRGEDTRTNFTSHFYKALENKGIDTFIDLHLERGEEVSPALLKAIEESRMSIIVFSENYASSRWCLDELVHILECRQSRQQIVWPVFYKVDPSDVRKQTNTFGDAFTKLKCRFKNNKEKIHAWRIALRDAANLSGYTFEEREYEATFISKIVKEILVRVQQRAHLKVANYPVGMGYCVEKVKELLGVSGNDPCVVGIWGSSGIGKTTVAKAVYNAIAYEFEGSCFLADVQETSMQYGGLLQLQNTLLSEIGGSEWKAVNPHRGNILIEKLLRRKKSILILDDVDNLEQLSNLVQVNWLGEGSRVIITTKNRGLLKSYDVELIYEVQKLEDDKALELLSLNAFGKKEPSDDYLGLARRAIAYARGHPLALNLIGSHLRNKSIDRWQAILDSYDSYDREPYSGIQKILQKSYDTLDYVMQQVFLDIACFFKGEDKDYVLQMLRSSKLSVPQDCIEILVEKAIITIEYNRILMHDLLEKMGKRIVREESPNEAGERSRLWHHEDVYRVLTKNRGTKKIKDIVAKFSWAYVIPLNAKSFFKMVNLEIFIIHNARFSGCVEYLPDDLRWIKFGEDGTYSLLQQHRLTFNLQSDCHLRHLVTFIMPNSGIRQLKGFQNLAMLTSLNLSRSEFLEKVPNLSRSPNLRELILNDCISLVEVDDSVGFLDKLVTLCLDGCTSLEKIPKLPSRLRLLQLTYCFKLSGDEVAKLENNLLSLNQESLLYSQLQVTYPGDEIPKPKHLTATRIESVQKDYDVGGSEFSFEISLNLQERETLLGLALSCVFHISEAGCYAEFEWLEEGMAGSVSPHVGLMLVDLENQGDICKVKFQLPVWACIEICGVHPLFRKEDERLPLSLGPTSSLGSSDIVDDEYDRQQQWPSLSSNPADVPSDVEEEQEQPSTISDLLRVWVSVCFGCLNFWCKPRK